MLNKFPKEFSIGYFLLASGFVLFVPILSGWNFFYGHVFFLAWVFALFFLGLTRGEHYIALSVVLLICLFLSLAIYQVLEYGVNHRFIQDSLKFSLLVISILILSANSSLSSLLYFLKIHIYIFPIVFSSYFLFVKDSGFFQYSGRLFDPLFGSPNAVAVFCGLAVLYMLCFFGKKNRLVYFSLLVFYSGVLVLSFSRAALLALLFSLTFLMRTKHIPIVLLGLFFLILPISLYLWLSFDFPSWISDKANLVSDLKETGGSYRLQIWIESIRTSLSSINLFLFGQGPGRIVIYLFGFKLIDQPHNFYLFLLLGYGVLIAGVFSFIWAGYFSIHLNRVFSAGRNRFFISVFVFYSIAFMMDTHIMTGQYFVAHALFLSCILHKNHLSRRDSDY